MLPNFRNQDEIISEADVLIAEIDILSFMIYCHDQSELDKYQPSINENLFITPAAKSIYRAIETIRIENDTIVSAAKVSSELRGICTNKNDLLSCFEFLKRINYEFNQFQIAEQVNILKIAYKKRAIDKLFQQVKKTPLTFSNFNNHFAAWKTKFDAILEENSVVHHYLSDDLVNEYRNLVHQAQDQSEIGDKFFKTGYQLLDHKIKGLIGGQLVVLAARPGLGKTTLAINLVCNNFLQIQKNYGSSSHHNRKAIGFFSLEMNKESILEKMVAIDSKLEIRIVKYLLEGKIPRGDDQAAIDISLDKIKNTNLLFCERSDITINQIANMIKIWSRNYDLKLVVIDYLQLINVEGSLTNPNIPQYQRIAKISRTLKTLANDLGICIFALAQLNRRSEERRGDYREPMISDLRESGSIEQDADIVLLLYQEAKMNLNHSNDLEPEEIDPTNNYFDNNVLLKIGKNRHGEIGTIQFSFERNVGIFKQQKHY